MECHNHTWLVIPSGSSGILGPRPHIVVKYCKMINPSSYPVSESSSPPFRPFYLYTSSRRSKVKEAFSLTKIRGTYKKHLKGKFSQNATSTEDCCESVQFSSSLKKRNILLSTNMMRVHAKNLLNLFDFSLSLQVRILRAENSELKKWTVQQLYDEIRKLGM